MKKMKNYHFVISDTKCASRRFCQKNSGFSGGSFQNNFGIKTSLLCLAKR